ncbi:ArdC family protein [candidate division KSB1 bacterium]
MKNAEVYQIVTNQVISNLRKAGSWSKMWKSFNGISLNGHVYSGINHLLLAGLDFDLPVYGTFNQIKKLGGNVKKGEKSHMIVFWSEFTRENEESGEMEKGYFLKIYNVFNVEQCEFDEIAESRIQKLAEKVVVLHNSRQKGAEDIISGFPDKPKIQFKDDIDFPFYSPKLDKVVIQKMKWFNTADSYYHTLFHELIHSTGHPSRLNRFDPADVNVFGGSEYSKEELVAELGASYLTEIAGLKLNIKNASAYIKGWIKALEDNTSWIVWAANRGQKAAELILKKKKEAVLQFKFKF